MSEGLDKLVQVVDQIDPNTLTAKDIGDIKAWAADQVAFVLVDVERQVIIHATPGAERIFGYVTDEMNGLPLTELVPEGFRGSHEHHVEAFGAAMTTRSMGRRDNALQGRARDGATFPVEIGLFPRKFKGRKYCLANVVRLDKQL